ncbi:MAG: FAD-dependent oxidoreductase, partial [Pseudomonadota bacterium]|nr:FAD-dependent oxidoreductase [Pseudomonadota bacterium]
RYFSKRIENTGVTLKLNTRVELAELQAQGFDEIVIATGVLPRTPGIPGIDHPKVLSYVDVLRNKAQVGEKVAVIGAGGIGFDVSEFLAEHPRDGEQPLPEWMKEWGVDMDGDTPGGLVEPQVEKPARQITLLQRKPTPLGKDLGKTSGWVHRATLKSRNVEMLRGCSYEKIDDAGLHIKIGEENRVLDVDHVIICAGQESLRELYQEGADNFHLIGGADLAAELDAKRAIRQGAEVAAAL